MVKKQQKPDPKDPGRRNLKKKPEKEPSVIDQVNATLNKRNDDLLKNVEALIKKQNDKFQAQINRLDGKSNVIAKQADRVRENPPPAQKNPIETVEKIFGAVEKIFTSPVAVKIADSFVPKEPPVTDVKADPEYIEYIKNRAKAFDDIVMDQMKETVESLKLKNLTSRKELESDF